MKRLAAASVTAVTMILAFLPLPPASAATITVNSTADTAANDGACTLREAITAANTNTASGGMAGECAAGSAGPTVDAIGFAIPGAGPHTIQPGSALPTITEPVLIDGYTEPGASPNTLAAGSNAVLMIELDGQAAVGANGLVITAGGSTVRGLAINRFAGSGLAISAGGGNTVAGTFIGTNLAGGADLGNNGRGVSITSPNNVIGGTTPDATNVISGNQASGVTIQDLAAGGNGIRGNLIGTNAAGTASLGNTLSGLTIFRTPNNTIVGNVISGNDWDGVTIIRPEATGNMLQGNRIGTNAAGTAPLPNGVNGVFIWQAPNTTIGGTSAGEGNLISGNVAKGVAIADATAVGNRVLGNAIVSNGDLGIDLGGTIDPGGDGITPNDPLDADTGPNDFQNFPELSWALSGGNTSVAGSLRSEPSGAYRVELFSSSSADPSGNGEGGTFLGTADVITDGAGNGSFVITVEATVPDGHVVAATATELAGGNPSNTSEFSGAVPVPPPCTIVGTPGDDVLEGTPGDDVICGVGGDDVLIGRGGNDALLGGAGMDAASYSGAAAGVTADLAGSKTSNDGEGGTDALAGIENLVGSRFSDSLKGDAGKNRLVGQAGGDRLAGRSGRDVLLGKGGKDRVRGGGGRDLLKAGGGPDRLWGQGGPDQLLGQGGNDDLDGGASLKDRCRQGPGSGAVRRCER